MEWYVYLLIGAGVFIVGYFVGCNNPTASIKAKLNAALQAENDKLKLGIKTEADKVAAKL